jgi:hypothetical protein
MTTITITTMAMRIKPKSHTKPLLAVQILGR